MNLFFVFTFLSHLHIDKQQNIFDNICLIYTIQSQHNGSQHLKQQPYKHESNTGIIRTLQQVCIGFNILQQLKQV